jgi:predicted RNase H-like HicB family nuclease
MGTEVVTSESSEGCSGDARAIRCSLASILGKALPIVIWKERDSYVAVEVVTNVSSFGSNVKEALEKLKEALELYLEDEEEMKKYLEEVERGEVVFVQGSLQSSTNSSLVNPAC